MIVDSPAYSVSAVKQIRDFEPFTLTITFKNQEAVNTFLDMCIWDDPDVPEQMKEDLFDAVESGVSRDLTVETNTLYTLKRGED